MSNNRLFSRVGSVRACLELLVSIVPEPLAFKLYTGGSFTRLQMILVIHASSFNKYS